jgi:hypothetical protein
MTSQFRRQRYLVKFEGGEEPLRNRVISRAEPHVPQKSSSLELKAFQGQLAHIQQTLTRIEYALVGGNKEATDNMTNVKNKIDQIWKILKSTGGNIKKEEDDLVDSLEQYLLHKLDKR